MASNITSTIDNVKLLGAWPSPYSNRVQIALNLKSIEYEFIQETFVPKSDLLLISNPVHKKIPVFFHNDNHPICESLVILEYIEDVWSKSLPLLPLDPHNRAITRFWATYIDNKWFMSFLETLVFGKGKEAIAAARERTIEETAVIEAAYWDISKGKPYFGGDKIGYLDIILGCFLGWLKFADTLVVDFNLINETKTPGLFGWAERFLSNDAVKSVVQLEPEKLMNSYYFLKAQAAARV